jgi:hypothetical protein
MAEHTIIIRHEPFGTGFDVTIEPPLEGESFDRELPTHKEAFGFAGGLRMVRGWPVLDLASDVAREDLARGRRK